MENLTLIQQWINGARINTMAHFKTASRYKQNDRTLGVIAALAGAIVTSSLFIAFSETEAKNTLWITGIISIISTALTTAYSFLKQAELSEKHYRAGTEFSHLRKKLELIVQKPAITYEELELINDEFMKLNESAPSIPQKIFDKCRKEADKKPVNAIPDTNSAKKVD